MPEPDNSGHPQKRAFLAALIESGGNITKAVKAAKIGRSTHYDWLRDDPEYPALFNEAVRQAGDVLESEAIRRASDGVQEPVFYQGEKCGSVRRYSDTLLIFLLKGARPDKYAERVENRHTGRVQHVHSAVNLSDLSDTDLENLDRIAAKLAGDEPADRPDSH